MRAARLYGAAEALCESLNVPLSEELPPYERHLAAAHSLIEDKIWEAAWEERRAMTLEQAISYTLEGTEEHT